jgi:hypothetical protein
MKTYREMEIWIHASLTFALDGGDWSVLRPGVFTAGESSPQVFTGQEVWLVWIAWRGEASLLLLGMKFRFISHLDCCLVTIVTVYSVLV